MNSPYNKKPKGFSKGNAVMTADMFDLDNGIYKGEEDKTAEETYCRSWTTLDRYDSVYKMVYNRSFEDLPVQAYLLACTYYLIKKDSSSKKDIEMISSEIKAIYGKSPSITFFK